MTQRIIKFRAWDEGNKIMHFDFQFIRSGIEGNDWVIFISDKFPLTNHKTNPFTNPIPYFSQQLKVMQYTGLKDKNGKEIYEEDILKHDYYSNGACFGSPQHQRRSVIHWYNKGGGYRLPGMGYEINGNKCEVIGNIYQNPTICPKCNHKSKAL